MAFFAVLGLASDGNGGGINGDDFCCSTGGGRSGGIGMAWGDLRWSDEGLWMFEKAGHGDVRHEVYSCLCLRTENRSRKTHVFEYRDCGGWGGVGGHVNVPCTSYMIYCHAAKISGIAYYVTCCYAAEISGIVYYIHKNADCQLITAHALQRWRWKTKKTRPKFFQDFQSSNQHGTAVKSPFFLNVRFMWTVSGPAGCLWKLIMFRSINKLMFIELQFQKVC